MPDFSAIASILREIRKWFQQSPKTFWAIFLLVAAVICVWLMRQPPDDTKAKQQTTADKVECIGTNCKAIGHVEGNAVFNESSADNQTGASPKAQQQ